MTEGLLHHHPGMLGKAGRSETLDNRAEQRGWYLQVEHGQRGPAESFRYAHESGRVREVPTDVGHALPQTLQGSLIDRRGAQSSSDRLRHAPSEILIGPVLSGNPDDWTVQQPAPIELIERHKGHLARQISTDTERDERISRSWALLIVRHRDSRPPSLRFRSTSLRPVKGAPRKSDSGSALWITRQSTRRWADYLRARRRTVRYVRGFRLPSGTYSRSYRSSGCSG